MIIGYSKDKGVTIEGVEKMWNEPTGRYDVLTRVVMGLRAGDELRFSSVEDLGSRWQLLKVVEWCDKVGARIGTMDGDTIVYVTSMALSVMKDEIWKEELSRRIKEGQERAREEGKVVGSVDKYVVDEEKENNIIGAYKMGMLNIKDACKELGGMSESNFYVRVKRWEKKNGKV